MCTRIMISNKHLSIKRFCIVFYGIKLVNKLEVIMLLIYKGEIARYLLAQPVIPEERQHSLQYVFGNGLRPQIWETFIHRFNIPRVVEFYGKIIAFAASFDLTKC